ncbi:G-protein coupled receptor family C group 6 member A-like isoform X1 [Pygocentrus nattereri]|uniref:G-protein coupled receptors family 3 profile domain-containing protein n=1 Tax=Pygocentrus nattereri TaxID=42514 RepID=A0A3B4CK40_PYGNA|nr:G-protein coupled receptor family C group 6 member A-like isoform X1 [Pygocentrus nattereri]
MFILMLIKLIFLFRNGFCLIGEALQTVSNPGDVVIGGLFPIHNKVITNSTVKPTAWMCDLASPDMEVLLYSQAMIYTIERINNSSLLPEVKIGYEIYDTCSSVFTALRASLNLMNGESPDQTCLIPNDDVNNTVKAVIGERSSEVSVAVARLLALPLMTQISYASTSELLSSRSKFPSFFRTVPSDKHQTDAIAQLVHKLNFVPVGIIGSEDEYGKNGAESLTDDFKQYNICVEFKIILPADFSQNSTFTELEHTLAKTRAEAIVLFTKETNAMVILKKAIMAGLNRTWIASDAWSTSKDILELEHLSKCGRIYGVTCKRNEVPGFMEYMDQFINQSNTSGSFFHNLLSKNPFCSTEPQDQNCSSFASKPVNQAGGQNCIYKKCLMDFIREDQSYEPYSIYTAVNVIAQGLESLLQKYNGTHFPAWMLTESIKQTSYSIDNTTNMTLNENGEVNIGYDILEWKTETPKTFTTIGKYEQSKISVDVVPENNNVTQFNCSKSCNPGFELYTVKPEEPCCKGCKRCEPKFFSNDGIKCQLCEASQKNSQCTTDFLEWTDGFSITLAVFSAIGLIVTLIVTVLFVIYSHTPIVRAAGGLLCFPALLSLLACFISPFFFMGEPTDANCRAGLPLFSLSFTICASCILANLLQISVGFSFKLKLGVWLKRVNQPVIVVLVCVSVQVVICAFWLIKGPPFSMGKINENSVILGCNEGSIELFVATQAYIALLCVICFFFAYKGRKLPDLYKNGRFITISMLIYLVVWIIFIPIYIQEHGKNERAIEASAILVSGYGILSCHFAPKCYILLFKKEMNDENMIAEYIRNHYEKKGIRIMS